MHRREKCILVPRFPNVVPGAELHAPNDGLNVGDRADDYNNGSGIDGSQGSQDFVPVHVLGKQQIE